MTVSPRSLIGSSAHRQRTATTNSPPGLMLVPAGTAASPAGRVASQLLDCSTSHGNSPFAARRLKTQTETALARTRYKELVQRIMVGQASAADNIEAEQLAEHLELSTR
jgi:hypothetical protein